MFGFGYYEGFRNTSGNTQNIVVLSDAQRQGNFGRHVIRDPLTGLPFPNNTIPAEPIEPDGAAKLLNEFVPRANSGGNRYIASPDTTDDRDQFGLRFDYTVSQSNSLLVRYMRSTTERRRRRRRRDRSAPRDGDAAGHHGVGHAHLQRRTLINVARFSYNRIGAQPAGHERPVEHRLRHQRAAERPSAARASRTSRVTGLFSLGDAQQPFVERLNEVLQFTDDFTWVRGKHSLKFGVDIAAASTCSSPS